jgi:hypothetical protein
VSNYGRNFEFRTPPHGGQRSGRFYLSGTSDIPIGAPVVYDNTKPENDLGLLPVKLQAGAANTPAPGMGGIVIYEHAPNGYAGHDPLLTTYSDIDTVPAGKACQVVSGVDVKVVLRNTEDRTFLNAREYAGRTMIAGLGATVDVEVGDLLSPGVGDDNDGYWAVTQDTSKAWLVVTKVDNDRGEVEARFVF